MNQTYSSQYFQITPVFMKLGNKNYGISPDFGELHLTLRAWEHKFLELKTSELLDIIKTISNKNNIKYKFRIFEKFINIYNDKDAVCILEEACKQTNMNYLYSETPFRWGEDFGSFTQKFKGAMFGIGAGTDCYDLHNPEYDFPDAIIENTVKLLYYTAITINK